jgi:hypothetical protein
MLPFQDGESTVEVISIFGSRYLDSLGNGLASVFLEAPPDIVEDAAGVLVSWRAAFTSERSDPSPEA